MMERRKKGVLGGVLPDSGTILMQGGLQGIRVEEH